MTSIDIIILSYGKDQHLRDLTKQTISSLIDSEDPQKIHFNVIVIESNGALAPFQYPNSKTIYPKITFGFNKFLNIGINATSSRYVCLCNNDLIFHRDWASEIIHEMENSDIICASTYCPKTHGKSGFKKNEIALEGYENLFSGWCFLVKRELFNKIGLLDEKFIFWYADHDFLKTIKKAQIKNYLISSSFVTHLNSSTSDTIDRKQFKQLSLFPLLYYNYKWEHKNYIIYILKYLYFWLGMKFNWIK